MRSSGSGNTLDRTFWYSTAAAVELLLQLLVEVAVVFADDDGIIADVERRRQPDQRVPTLADHGHSKALYVPATVPACHCVCDAVGAVEESRALQVQAWLTLLIDNTGRRRG